MGKKGEKMEKGKIIEITYTAKELTTGSVFDTTDEKTAKKEQIYEEGIKYGPITIVVGGHELITGLDEEVQKMKTGEAKNIKITPEKGFGNRNPKYVAVVPLKQFQKEKMNPIPGLIVEINGKRGRVQSVSGGRVRIDFNHPLAGRELEYALKVENEITDLEKGVEKLFEKYFGMLKEEHKKFSYKDGIVKIEFPMEIEQALSGIKHQFSHLLTGHVTGIKEVKYETTMKSKEKDAKQNENAKQETNIKEKKDKKEEKENKQ